MFKNIDLSKQHTQDWLAQSGNMFVADLVGTTVEALAIANIHKFEMAFPKVTETAMDILAGPAEYLQKPIEFALNYTKGVEGKENYENRLNKTSEERKQSYAKAMFRYGAAMGVGWATTMGTAKLISSVSHTPKIPNRYWFYDGAVHLGLVAAMNLPMVTPVTEKTKDVVNVVAKALGANSEQAEDISRLAVVSAIPNYATFGIISRQLYKDNKLEALGKQLNAGTSMAFA